MEPQRVHGQAPERGHDLDAVGLAVAVGVFLELGASGGSSPGLPGADQGVDGLCHAWLGRHPLQQQALKAFHIQLSEQQPKRGIRSWLGDLRAQQLVERHAVALGKTLHAEQRTLAAQDRKDRHQQHPPLRESDSAAHAAIGQCLEETDQISCGSGVLERRGQRRGAVPGHQTGAGRAAPPLLGHTSNGPWGGWGREAALESLEMELPPRHTLKRTGWAYLHGRNCACIENHGHSTLGHHKHGLTTEGT